MTATALIAHLNLAPLPHEGGYFKRTWTSPHTLPDDRPAGTAIYFLLTPDGFSALHRLDADELWHFHTGDAVCHVQLPATDSPPLVTTLGADIAAGHSPQLIVRAGSWQAARLAADTRHGWALLSCTMTPGWSDAGFELAQRTPLLATFPREAELIFSLTRPHETGSSAQPLS